MSYALKVKVGSTYFLVVPTDKNLAEVAVMKRYPNTYRNLIHCSETIIVPVLRSDIGLEASIKPLKK